MKLYGLAPLASLEFFLSEPLPYGFALISFLLLLFSIRLVGLRPALSPQSVEMPFVTSFATLLSQVAEF